jgi:hypothetical protein
VGSNFCIPRLDYVGKHLNERPLIPDSKHFIISLHQTERLAKMWYQVEIVYYITGKLKEINHSKPYDKLKQQVRVGGREEFFSTQLC